VQSAFEVLQARGGGLDDHLPLLIAFDGTAPAKERVHLGQHVDARREAFLDQLLAEHRRIGIKTDRSQDDKIAVGHGTPRRSGQNLIESDN
jgi:hypothetical protein